MKTKKSMIYFLISVFLLASLAGCAPAAEAEEPAAEAEAVVSDVQVALLLDGGTNDMTWSFDAYEALQNVTESSDSASILGVAEYVAEADAASTMRDYADRGANLIIANSFGFWEAGQTVCAEYPGLVVVYPGGDESLTSECEGTFYPETYEATYLIGMLAAGMTETGHVGYILSNAIPPLVAETNAFIKGVEDTDDSVTVDVIVTGSWYDPPREREAAEALIDSGVDFIGFQLNATTAIDAAKEADIMIVPPFVDQSYMAPNNIPTSSLWSWESYYQYLIDGIADGTWESSVDYWGIAEGMADLADLGPMVPDDVKDEIAAKYQEIVDGTFEAPYVADVNLWEE